jgi:hypothetical protein
MQDQQDLLDAERMGAEGGVDRRRELDAERMGAEGGVDRRHDREFSERVVGRAKELAEVRTEMMGGGKLDIDGKASEDEQETPLQWYEKQKKGELVVPPPVAMESLKRLCGVPKGLAIGHVTNKRVESKYTFPLLMGALFPCGPVLPGAVLQTRFRGRPTLSGLKVRVHARSCTLHFRYCTTSAISCP